MTKVFDLVLPNDCPLAGAIERQQTAYRVVKTNPPTDEDFLTYQELGQLPKANLCKRAAVSIYPTARQAKHRIDLSPHLGTLIAKAELSPDHGQVSHPNTESGHISWWPYQGMRQAGQFVIVES